MIVGRAAERYATSQRVTPAAMCAMLGVQCQTPGVTCPLIANNVYYDTKATTTKTLCGAGNLEGG